MGCGTVASVFSDAPLGYEAVTIHTNEKSDVKIFVNNEEVAAQKGSVLLSKRRNAHFVTVKKDGYRPVTQYFSRDVNGIIVFLDALLIVPLIVDIATWEIYDINPRDIRINLRKDD